MKKPSHRESASIPLSDEEAVRQVLGESVFALWDVVNNLTRLRATRRERYRVTIFGSARAKKGTFGYEETRRLAAALARMGCDIVTGGGPGLMQAANEGAAASPRRSKSVGIRVTLPFEQNVNAFVTQSLQTEISGGITAKTPDVSRFHSEPLQSRHCRSDFAARQFRVIR